MATVAKGEVAPAAGDSVGLGSASGLLQQLQLEKLAIEAKIKKLSMPLALPPLPAKFFAGHLECMRSSNKSHTVPHGLVPLILARVLALSEESSLARLNGLWHARGAALQVTQPVHNTAALAITVAWDEYEHGQKCPQCGHQCPNYLTADSPVRNTATIAPSPPQPPSA